MAWILPFPRKEAPGFSGFLGSMLDFLPRAHFQFAVHPPPSSGPPSREVLGQKVRICGQSLCFGRLLFIFGLRVEFFAHFFLALLFYPLLARFWAKFWAERAEYVAILCSLQHATCSFGLSNEFSVTFLSPLSPSGPILGLDFDATARI